MQPQITIRPSFIVMGMKYHGPNQHDEIPQLWRTFSPRMGEIQHIVNPTVSYGVMDNYDAPTGAFDYLAGMEVESADEMAADMTTQKIPAQTYAVFPCTLSTIAQTYDTIYQSWLPNSHYHRVDGPEFELYDEHFDLADPKSVMYLYIPWPRTNNILRRTS